MLKIPPIANRRYVSDYCNKTDHSHINLQIKTNDNIYVLMIWRDNNLENVTSSFCIQVLKGFGQIMLQENALTGLIFLIGIFYGSPLMGVAGLIAVLVGTTTARLLKFDKADIDKGLYGFNAALIGVACILFFKTSFIVWGLVIIGSILATLIQYFFLKRKASVYTLTFVLITWLFVLLANHYFSSILIEKSAATPIVHNDFSFSLIGFGQVIFQSKLIPSLLFFVAVFINSPIAALYGLAGATLGGVISYYFSAPVESISIGLFSYNAVLCAIAFVGNRIKDSIWILASVLLSVVLSLVMTKYDLLQLTFPFVVASIIILFVKNKVIAMSRNVTTQIKIED